jgi:hypothetical protein
MPRIRTNALSALLALLTISAVFSSGCGGEPSSDDRTVAVDELKPVCAQRTAALAGPNDEIVAAVRTGNDDKIGAAYLSYAKAYEAETRRFRRQLGDGPPLEALRGSYARLSDIYEELGRALRRGDEAEVDKSLAKKRAWTAKRVNAAKVLNAKVCGTF